MAGRSRARSDDRRRSIAADHANGRREIDEHRWTPCRTWRDRHGRTNAKFGAYRSGQSLPSGGSPSQCSLMSTRHAIRTTTARSLRVPLSGPLQMFAAFRQARLLRREMSDAFAEGPFSAKRETFVRPHRCLDANLCRQPFSPKTIDRRPRCRHREKSPAAIPTRGSCLNPLACAARRRAWSCPTRSCP